MMINLLKCKSSLLSKITQTKSLRQCWKSTVASPNYTTKEILIPIQRGHFLAGKLWTTNGEHHKRAPIICVHGWLDNAGSFDPLLSILCEQMKDLTVLAIDLPGHGFSSHSALTHYDTFMDGRPIHHMNWEKVTLLSHSLGSILSFIFAGTFPEYMDRYVALDTLHPIPLETVKSLRSSTKSVIDVEQKIATGQTPTYTYEEILQRTFDGRKGTVTMDGCKILLERGAVKLPNGKYSFTHDLRVKIAAGAGRFSVEQSRMIGAEITCPVCVIKGEPGSDYEPRPNFLKGVDNLKKNSKNVEFHLAPGTHHFHLNEPHLIAPIISKFLDS